MNFFKPHLTAMARTLTIDLITYIYGPGDVTI